MNTINWLKWSRAAVGSVLVTIFLALGAPSQAQFLITASGDLARLDPPRVMRRTSVQDDKKILIVEEQQGDFLSHDLLVDVSGTGTFTQFPRSQGLISSGTMVDCTLAFVSPAAQDVAKYDFSMTFANKILGVIATGDLLQKTNLVLGNSETNYPNQIETQGLNLDGTSDSDTIAISPNSRTVTVHLSSTGQLKMLRIITGGSGMPDLSHIYSSTPTKAVVTRPVMPKRTHNGNRYRRNPYALPTYTIIQ